MLRLISEVCRRSPWNLVAIGTCLVAIVSVAWADVEVTLKSGASLVGKAKIDGTEVVVSVDDSELRVPLAEVDSITSVDAAPDRQARRLLLTALETRMAKEDSASVIGLLAEAMRLAPNDPHIAYWYATSLADAGYGQAANDVLSKHREAIANTYPRLIDSLAKRVERRVAMEKLSPALIERLDALSAELAQQSADADLRRHAVMFRVVDHEKIPVHETAFRVHTPGANDEKVESFDEGYFIYTYNRHRNNQLQPSSLEISMPGVESRSFELQTSSGKVQDAGELVARRYGEDAKRTFRILVSRADKNPILGAKVAITPITSQGGSADHSLSVETDAEGKAEIALYPMKYTYSVAADGFHAGSGSIEIKEASSEPVSVEQMLYRAIHAKIRLAWEASSMQPQGAGKTAGESVIEFGGNNPPAHHLQSEVSWLRPFQHEDELRLQFVDSFFGYGGPFGQGAGAWVRIVNEQQPDESDAAAKDDAPAEQADADTDKTAEAIEKPEAGRALLAQFKAIEFEELDKLKDKLPAPTMAGGGQRTGPNPPIVLPAEAGRIYVGNLQHRDMRTGQPIQVAFKVLVEELQAE